MRANQGGRAAKVAYANRGIDLTGGVGDAMIDSSNRGGAAPEVPDDPIKD
jgi:hypothetical protein